MVFQLVVINNGDILGVCYDDEEGKKRERKRLDSREIGDLCRNSY
jgi:hypothetical protein